MNQFIGKRQHYGIKFPVAMSQNMILHNNNVGSAHCEQEPLFSMEIVVPGCNSVLHYYK